MPYSPDVEEIIYEYPDWTRRWGLLCVCCFVAIILILAWFIRYPESITSETTLTTNIVTTGVVSKSSGQLIYLTTPNAVVAEGTPLGLIRNSTNYDEVRFIKNCFIESHEDSLRKTFHLGELQTAFNTWLSAYNEYHHFKNLKFHDRQMSGLRNQLLNYSRLQNESKDILKLTKKEMEIEVERFKTDSILHKQSVLADRDLQSSDISLIAKKLKVKNSATVVQNNQIEIQQIANGLVDIEIQKQNEELRLSNAVQAAKNDLLSAIDIWQSKYLLTAPISGTVVFANFNSNNIFVETGNEVFFISPNNNNSDLRGRTLIPAGNSGKVKPGQKILVKLHDFPYREYGVLIGQVERISIVPMQNSYVVDFKLPSGVVTSYNKSIVFKNKMTGTSEIIVDDTRLLSRLFYNLRYIFNSR